MIMTEEEMVDAVYLYLSRGTLAMQAVYNMLSTRRTNSKTVAAITDAFLPIPSPSTDADAELFLAHCKQLVSKEIAECSVYDLIQMSNYSSFALQFLEFVVLPKGRKGRNMMKLAHERVIRDFPSDSQFDNESEDDEDTPRVGLAMSYVEQRVRCDFGNGQGFYVVRDCGHSVAKGDYVLLEDERGNQVEVSQEEFDQSFIPPNP